MMIWMIIMVTVLILAAGAVTYLCKKINRIPFVKRVAKGHKVWQALLCLVVVAAGIAILWLFFGMINAIIILLHLVGFFLIADLVMWIVGKVRGQKVAKRFCFEVGAVLFSIGYLCVGWYLAHHVWTTYYDIDTNKNVGNIRVVQFADSHVGTTFDGKEFAAYVDEMQQQKPDVVVITGDFVDDDTTKEDMVAACEALSKLKPTYGVYYAFGNHDKGYYGSDFRGYSGNDLMGELEKNGVTVLQDENVLIDNRFYIVGRQDRSEEMTGDGRADVDTLMAGLDKTKYVIMLDHQPNDYDNEEGKEVDLVLSGHTHGGQLLPVTLVGEWTGTNDLTYGLEERGDTKFLVTSGISDWAIDFKTGCKSEFVVINIAGK